MKSTHCCPKCHSIDVVRVPDDKRRYSSGNNIYTSTFTLIRKIPVIRYVCTSCGYTENWVESANELREIRKAFG